MLNTKHVPNKLTGIAVDPLGPLGLLLLVEPTRPLVVFDPLGLLVESATPSVYYDPFGAFVPAVLVEA